MTTPPSPAADATDAGRCLVFGASGYIGSHLVPRLLAAGIPVRASSRNRASLERRGWEAAELVEADALAPQTLDAALAGIDTAYYLVHSMGAGKDFGRLDLAAAANFAAAAERAGVRRIVYLGGLVPDDADSEHIVSRRDTGDVLRRGRVPVTELRAGIIVGPGSAAFEVMRDLVYHLPVMVTPRWVRAQSPPLALDNLLTYLVRLPQIPEAAGRVFDAGGPETLTYQQMMRILAEEGGRRPPIVIPVPVLSPKLSSYWLRLITAVPTNIARALIEGLKHDFSADDAALRRLVPQQLLGFREAVRAVFAAERASEPVVARWIEGAFAVREQRIDYAYYAKRASAAHDTKATPAAVWSVLREIGGERGWFYLNGLWQLRETLDWVAGGPGRQHGRRHPTQLRVGDRIDSWKVLGLEPERRLSLAFGMRAPGAGMMEFELKPLPDGGTRLGMTAYWHPAGVWGLLYWYAFAPAHGVVFTGTVKEICRLAEVRERRGEVARAG
ncbi:SDR family oxidoreductase [uncultured Thiohalocapsa sp.]|uniref:SDR family oxidoreductase n=1 Tax=uncultured Thiohalocapsa sp. TaxID=768990 RepID=UPI0025EB3516|nr:SDR family oxidoreductase [uncultured Thiohalocapsa sp.]